MAASWSGDDVAVTISDDGAGLRARDHGPDRRALRHQPPAAADGADGEAGGHEASGLGLGFFIAKTLLERSGATLDFENRAFPERGAVVRVRWDRSDFEQRIAFAS